MLPHDATVSLTELSCVCSGNESFSICAWTYLNQAVVVANRWGLVGWGDGN